MKSINYLTKAAQKGILITLLLLCYPLFVNAEVAPIDWPQELTMDEGTLVIYQPQPESLQGKTLTGRAAMSMELKNSDSPIYGVFWFTSQIETDRDTDSVTISKIKVNKVSWPDSKDAAEQRFTSAVEKTLVHAKFNTSLSKLSASLTASKKVSESLKNIKNDPPEIIFRDQLAVLLLFDGKPIFKTIENSHYQRALNTPMAVVKDSTSDRYYLTSGSLWYQADDALGPWAQTTKPPTDLVAMMAKSTNASQQAAPKKVPAIVTASKLTELIVSDGKPNWISLVGGKLLYVKNTETPWLRDLDSNSMYILLSGRWYHAQDQNSNWTFVRADELPASFNSIPPESDIGGIRTSIAGTEEADQAITDAQIPQTAAIKRSGVKLEIKYDGDPQFKHIEDTDVAYAINTATQVLLIDDVYYAVDNAVWFTAKTPIGPWIVADSIPNDKIAEIPASSPVFNTTYVTIYDSTPDVVYVGYTSGYLWSYPYYGVPIYGTGWYYPPYYGHYYYPRAPTWGLHVGYNPWGGWNMGVSWGGPFFSVGISWGGHGRYGYGGYHHNNININNNNNININTGDINIGNNISAGSRTKAANKLGSKASQNNLYKNAQNKHRNAGKPAHQQQLQKARKNSQQRKNNIYADKSGNVVRRNGDQWQTRNNDQWKSMSKDLKAPRPQSKPQFNSQQLNSQQRPAQKQPYKQQHKPQSRPNNGFNHQQMNREHRARNMGTMQHRSRSGGRAGGGRLSR
ncbi:MAG: hypothetical protein JKY50_13225 [Oleispira sp.]|nr:hypothetical protein [Oleispira sp.]MBL4880371.1 hypothetical protein [Oleispira sp.]